MRVRPLTVAALLPLAMVGSASADPSLEVFQRDIQPILSKYCFDCHGNGVDKAGVRLDAFDTSASLHDPKLWLRALKNVRAGIMPPPDEDQLSPAEAEKLMQWIKRDAFGLDPAKPDPGRVTVRRLNRVEYRNTIRDLTGIDYDTQKEFPADDTGYGFDNIADVLNISPMLLEKYLDAAQAIVAQSVPMQPRVVAENYVAGRKFATVKVDTTVPAPKPAPAATEMATAPVALAASTASVASATTPPPAGAASAASAVPAEKAANADKVANAANAEKGRGRRTAATSPAAMRRPAPYADGDQVDLSYYTPATVAATHKITHAGKYQVMLDVRALERYVDEQFDQNRCRLTFTVDGEKLLEYEFAREGGRKFEFPFDREWQPGDHTLSVEITPLTEKPQPRNLRLRLNGVAVRGPMAPEYWVKPKDYDKTFPRETPADLAGRRAYARELLEKFATRAYRHPVEPSTLDRLVSLAEGIYTQPKNTFEAGVAQAMVAVLGSPGFIFREERVLPLSPGQAHPQIDEFSLASRLSYFLWSTMPDAELMKLARENRLRAELPAQLQRMLADSRSKEFVRNFTGQWLQVRDIANVQITALDVYLRDHPSPEYEEARRTFRRGGGRGNRTPAEEEAATKARAVFAEFNRLPKPELTGDLRRAMADETEMTFSYVLKEDRSALELIESDYTFLNEDLAKHYGIEGVTGRQMRKVALPPGSPRGGVLTQGTVLSVTSNPTRTSPVKRGVFILDAILGTPPPPPPPNIPSLEDAAPADKLRKMNLRETMALHAREPLCSSCHNRMDPLGLALENFNAMGRWRTADLGQPIEPGGRLITGEKFSDIRELKHVLATSRHRDFYYALTERLLTYALGRGLDYRDTVTVDQLVTQLESSGGKLSTLLQGIVNSAPFQQRSQTVPALASATTSPRSSSEE